MLGKQAKVLTGTQIKTMLHFVATTRHSERNKVIFLLSVKAGLRAKEVAGLTWGMVLDGDKQIGEVLRIPDSAAKGRSGGIIPLATDLKAALFDLLALSALKGLGDPVIQMARGAATSAQVIVNIFADWYRELGFTGCSSHSGRRTFITQTARHIGLYGGSLRDVQALARHKSLSMTQRYIEIDTEAMRRVVNW